MAERRVAQIVRERHGFREILVEPQRAGDGARHLADFQRMGQPGAEMLALVVEEDLRLVLRDGGNAVEWMMRSRSRWNSSASGCRTLSEAGPGFAPDRRRMAPARSFNPFHRHSTILDWETRARKRRKETQ